MAINPQFKVNQIAKDLGVKSKTLTDILAEEGVENVKTQRTLTPREFDVLFENLTRENQITNIEDYLDGVTVIPSKKAAKEEKAPAPAPEPAQAPTPAEAAKAEAPAPRAESPKAEPVKAAAPAEQARPAAPTEAPKAAAPRTGAPKAEAAQAEVRTEAPKAETPKTAAPAEPAQAESARTETARPGTARPATPTEAPRTAPRTEMPRRNDAPRPSAPATGNAAGNGNGQSNGNRPPFNRPGNGTGNGTNRPMNGATGPRPTQGDRPQNPNGGYGYRQDRPQGTFNGNNRDGAAGGRPASSPSSYAPRQNGFGGNSSGAPRPQGGYGYNNGNRDGATGSRPASGNFSAPYGQKQGGFGGGNRPQSSRPGQGNRGGGGFDKDREYNQVGGLKETFHPQATIRIQNNSAPVQRGATRIVDTRGGTTYDPSKYDEKLETFVSEKDRTTQQGGGKIKRQTPGTARGTSNKGTMGRNSSFGKKKMNEPAHILPQNVTLPEEMMVSDLASALKVKTGEVVKALMMMGVMATVNQVVDYDTAALVADSLGVSTTKQVVVSIEDRLFDEEEDSADTLVPRAPVVCVMGHVDHGKTSLLDAIRHTNVTAGEAGGITQHIGAYRVKVKGQDITFLDTPGHEAFTAMRARGAQSTDIAILVVAADDGIMPQTVEAIRHAKAAGVDIIVAINKMDKPGANPEGVKQELTKYDLIPEEWGGDVMCVPVSALTGQGIDDLLESVLLVAEVKELKANPNRRAKGIVIEAKLDRGRGPVATILVQNGTLHDGDIVIAGTAVGRVRAMTDYRGKTVRTAGPSVPVEITGLSEVPVSGDEFQAVEDEKMARELADKRKNAAKEEGFRANARANLNDLFSQISEGVKNLNIIVKADVVGSAEAVKASLLKISNEEVKVCVIHSAAGGINEGDVMLAAASNAIIVGFNVRPDKTALDSAERQGVEIRSYRVIYDCIEEITAAMKGMLAPKYEEVLLGHAEVRQTIHVPNVGTVAGSYVTDGKVTRNAKIRVLRDSVVIFEDEIASLKRFKDDAKEVAQGFECGIALEKFNDIKVGDVLEAYMMQEIKQ